MWIVDRKNGLKERVMGREFELKFAATAEKQAAIAEKYGVDRVIAMATTYYDTPDGALSARHITLRQRRENGVAVCTVKTPLADGSRGEWELEWDDVETMVSELCKLGAPGELLELTAGGIAPVCGARFTRRARAIPLGNSEVELALDEGVLIGGTRELPLCEVEVELKSGSDDDARAFAALLAQEFGLTPEKKSKFRRAQKLAQRAETGETENV